MKFDLKSLSLSVLFLVLVAVPLIIVIRRMSADPIEFNPAEKERLRIVVPATKEGRFVEIAHNPEINPQSGKDFIMLFWVKLKKLPEAGDRLILASKYEGSPPNVTGYALGVRRDEDVLRPIVYWGPHRGRGRWYDFPEFTLLPEAWNLFALSFHKDKFLGLRRIQEISGSMGPVETLGGYELTDGVGEFSAAPLILGASPNRGFKGFIGPLAVIAKRNLSEDFSKIIEQYRQNPLVMPPVIGERHVRLFVLPDLIDRSRFNHKVFRRGRW